MREIDMSDIAWTIAGRCHNEEEVKSVLAQLANVDYNALIDKVEYERHQWKCDLCHEFKDRRTFTCASDKVRGRLICPECFIAKATFQAVCIGCDQIIPALVDMERTCSLCATLNIAVSNNNTRARKLHLPATLTLRQWVQTVKYFHEECAYCSRPYQCVEHYLPLSLNGGSTLGNCLPGCYRCNRLKDDRHPNDFDALFSASHLARIRAYQDTMAQP